MASYNAKNPIRSINGVYVAVPYKYDFAIHDISDEAAGRTEDLKMQKNMIGRKISISVGWEFLKTIQVAEILTAVKNQYFTVVYYDPSTNRFESGEFYADADRTLTGYDGVNGTWDLLEFDLIER